MATKKLRTECSCQPVAFMIAAIVVPLGCRSRARTFSCLVLGRRKAGLTVLRFAVLFGCVVGAMFVRMLLCDMVRSSQLRRHMRRHRRSPTVATSPAGQDPRAQEACVSIGTTNALFAAEVQSYLQGKCVPAGSFRGRPRPNSYPARGSWSGTIRSEVSLCRRVRSLFIAHP